MINAPGMSAPPKLRAVAAGESIVLLKFLALLLGHDALAAQHSQLPQVAVMHDRFHARPDKHFVSAAKQLTKRIITINDNLAIVEHEGIHALSIFKLSRGVYVDCTKPVSDMIDDG
jgi:hypothetical protein